MAYYNAVPQLLHDQWPIKKALTFSDIDITHPFLTLSRQQVEAHIVVHMTPQQQDHLRADGQVSFNAHDYDTNEISSMKLKWRGSYYSLIGKWGKVVRTKRLEVGQEIKLRWLDSCLHFSVPQQHIVTVVPPVRMVASPLVHDSWPIRKTLTSSDVDNWPIKKALPLLDVDTNHPFLTLPGKGVEDHILVYWAHQAREQLRNDQQVSVNARDYDTGDLYVMKLKWRGSYYNLIGKWGKIIREKRLRVGREIRVRWENGCVVFSVP